MRPLAIAAIALAAGMPVATPFAAAAAAPEPPPPAKERLAVLVLGTTESNAELADNLTEVIIAAIAQHRPVEITGREELKARLDVQTEQRARACIDDVACLGRAAVSLGVRRIVTGTVGAHAGGAERAHGGGPQYLFNLNLTNIETGRVENHFFRLVDGGVPDLILAVQAAAADLFRPRIEPGRVQVTSSPAGARVSIDNAFLGVTPLISGTLLAGPHQVHVESDGRFPWRSKIEVLPGHDLGIDLTEANLPRRRAWPGRAATGATALAALSFAAGGFLAVLSQLGPSGATRAEAQADFEQKQDLGMAANVFAVSGVVLSAASLYLVLRYQDDIFGR